MNQSEPQAPLSCPACFGQKFYPIRGRGVSRCAACKYEVSETSGTIWKHSKLSKEARDEILSLVASGMSGLAVARKMKLQYKTVWAVIQKVKEAPPAQDGDIEFRIGDNVESLSSLARGEVVGFTGAGRCVRVRTADGRSRIWLKENVYNLDDEERFYEEHWFDEE